VPTSQAVEADCVSSSAWVGPHRRRLDKHNHDLREAVSTLADTAMGRLTSGRARQHWWPLWPAATTSAPTPSPTVDGVAGLAAPRTEQCLSIRYTDSLADVGAAASVDSRGDSYDKAVVSYGTSLRWWGGSSVGEAGAQDSARVGRRRRQPQAAASQPGPKPAVARSVAHISSSAKAKRFRSLRAPPSSASPLDQA
jgi:hypothetical protein